jgi:pyruvate formate lyase activating enzyme
MDVEAKYYQVASGRAECLLCPVHCRIAPGKSGKCFGRTFSGGKLIASNYGKTGSWAVDPIEKKPLYHFYPGRDILSVGPNGCNLDCQFCQNWTLSQTRVSTEYVRPDDLVLMALKHRSVGVAYTYSEPLIWFEYLLDTMPLLREKGLKSVLVTNGYINPDPFAELAGHVDAMNIDLKSMEPGFYKKYCKGTLSPVLKTIETAASQCHVEITNLVLPGVNDTVAQMKTLAAWVGAIDRDIPLHLSAYFPNYKFDLPPTQAGTLKSLYEEAKEHLNYVYLGNVRLAEGNHTACPGCGEILIQRAGYHTAVQKISKGRCEKCGTDLKIVMD